MKKRIGLLICLLLATVCAFALADAAPQAADDRLQLTVDGGTKISLPVYDSCTFHLHVEGQPNEVRLVLDKAYDVTYAFEDSQDADLNWMTFDIGEGEYTWPVYAEVSYEGEDGPVYSNPVNMNVTFGEALPGELTYTVMTGTSLPHGLSYHVTVAGHIPHGKAIGYFEAGYLAQADEKDRQHLLAAAGFASLEEWQDFYAAACGGELLPRELLLSAVDSLLASPAKLKKAPFAADRETLLAIAFFGRKD